ncbi:MAG: hypothetical protein MI723_09095 [Caulobacterales bacterium]|nr:hypothetical protein [Caulobacterales bacterium]
MFLAGGEPLFDRLGPAFTLLCFGGATGDALARAAEEAGAPLKVVAVDDAHAAALYERKLVLVRPDQHVAWRGDAPPDDHAAARIIETVTGMA